MRVLSISGELPRPGKPGSLAPVARQMASLQKLGVDVEYMEISGPPKIKYLMALRAVRTRVRSVDLIHAHFGFSAWVGLAQRRRPVVASFMGGDIMGTLDRNGRLSRGSRLARPAV